MKSIDIIKPDIYDEFQCKGAVCRRTCCTGWRITISKAEYQDLKERLSTAGSKLLRRLPEEKRIPLMYGEFILEGHRGCSLQSEEGLCRLQLSLGAKALPDVCASFPRRGIRCSEQMQLSLTPACEKVIELLLEKNGPIEFIRKKEPLPQMHAARFSGKNESIDWNHYIQLQEFCMLLLQAEDVSLDHRMALLGLGLYQIDQFYKRGEIFKVSGYIDRYITMLSQSEDVTSRFPSDGLDPIIPLGNFLASLPSSASQAGYSETAKKVMEGLRVTTHTKENTNKKGENEVAKEVAFTYSKEEYEQHKERFAEFTKRHSYFLENIMVLLFAAERWASLPKPSRSIWEQYLYACWVYSNLKFVLTACMEADTADEELVDICVVLSRSWIHNESVKEAAIKRLHETNTDTPAHMAMMVQAG